MEPYIQPLKCKTYRGDVTRMLVTNTRNLLSRVGKFLAFQMNREYTVRTSSSWLQSTFL